MPRYVILPIRVADSLRILRSAYTHPHFAAYLALKRKSVERGSERDLPLDYDEFWEAFMRVGRANPKKPYLRPFLDEKASDKNRLFNSNVAGSYAYSSFRGTLLQVVDGTPVKVKTRTAYTYSFKSEHWLLASKHLLRSTPIPINDLVIFLYRDYALETDTPPPSVAQLVEVFRGEFGYLPAAGNSTNPEFDLLFTDDGAAREGVEWFQEIE